MHLTCIIKTCQGKSVRPGGPTADTRHIVPYVLSKFMHVPSPARGETAALYRRTPAPLDLEPRPRARRAGAHLHITSSAQSADLFAECRKHELHSEAHRR